MYLNEPVLGTLIAYYLLNERSIFQNFFVTAR
jgi:hypothetical protein